MTSSHEPGDRSRTQRTNDRSSSRPENETSAVSAPPSPQYPTVQYFRQPRHSLIRGDSTRAKVPLTSTTPSHESLASADSASSRASSDIARPTLIASNGPPSSSTSGSASDDWHDTHSVPLGPRWHDYTYRDGDGFYGGTPRIATRTSTISKPASSTKHKSAAALHAILQSVSDAVSALRINIVSTLHTQPVQPQSTGLEVSRPSRVLHPEDQNSL